jgi:type I restriction enzyme, S subunit
MSVRFAKLGDVVEVTAGQGAPQNSTEFADEGVPFIRAGSLEQLLNGGTLDDCKKIPKSTAAAHQLRLFPKDTVVFAKSGMSATLGRIYRLPKPAYVVNHLAALVPTGRYNPRFLTYWLQRYPPSNLIPNKAYPSIRLSTISAIEVPALRLVEQERIALILDKADAIRRQCRGVLLEIDRLPRAFFLDTFGMARTNPKGFAKECLGNLIGLRSGDFLPARDMDPGGKHAVYGGNGINGRHSRYMFEEPKIVIGRVGVYCGVVHVSEPKSWVTDNALYVDRIRADVEFEYLTSDLLT